jgi:hypothetical protein
MTSLAHFRRAWPIVAGALSIALIAMLAPSASASTAPPTESTAVASSQPGGAVLVQREMRVATVAGVVRKGAHVSVIRLTTGAAISIPTASLAGVLRASAAAKAAVLRPGNLARPDNLKTGPCGVSDFYLYDKSNGYPWEAITGFTIVPAYGVILSWVWLTSYSGPKGYSTQNTNSGPAPKGTTSVTITVWSTTNPAHGTYSGDVSQASYALMTDDVLCTSAGPSDTEKL